ncbi:hypothetical protein SAMN05443665_100159 [Actinomadura meyerae]|uniref:Peptidase S74 domain-containing protein n=1 Tax=Actinomadura meyerae TaxID=240840 RepID=A0A239BU15_9ACTN|nr:hypothetical protein [Actinomadura meyerae]SNS11535.1 hypothetical protein SAMN05443665_100159 [Actinomadura meyerae]
MRQIEFQAIDPDTGARTPLPDVQTWDLSPIRGEQGVVRLTYPSTGQGFEALHMHVQADRDVFLALRVDGIERPGLTVIISESKGDTADPEAVWSFSGRFQTQLLDEAIVAPDTESDFGEVPDAEREFSTATAGEIIGTLCQEAAARGALAGVGLGSFSFTHDSTGAPWAKITTLTLAPGQTVLEVLNTLTEQGLCEWYMDGLELGLYNPGNFGRDLTALDPPVIFHGPRDLTDAPRTHSVKNSATSVYVAGKDGLYLDRTDPTALARRGRRIEVYGSAGNIADEGTLTAYAETRLAQLTPGTLEVSHGLAMAGGGPLPIDDFDIGDWVWSDTGNGLEKLQVAQWSVSMDKAGKLTGTVTLNDLIASRAAQLDRAIKALSGGRTVVGTSAPPPEPADSVAPAAPSGLVASSLAYTTSTGQTQAQITGAWAAVTLNEDGSPCEDLRGYRVRWRYTDPDFGADWHSAGETDAAGGETLSWSPVAPGLTVQWQVAAFDDAGNVSDWSAVSEVLTGADATPPPVPSAPVVTAYLGQLKAVWDGLGAFGEVMPADFARCEVHLSTVNGFTPSSATLVDTLRTAGTSVLTGLTYGTEYFVRLVTVDVSGNASAASVQASGVPRTVGLEDIAFKDRGNLIEDGSFEDASVRHQRAQAAGIGSAFSFADTIAAYHGRWVLAMNATVDEGTTRELSLSGLIPVVEGDEFYLRVAARRTAATDGTLRVITRFYDSEEDFQRSEVLDVAPGAASQDWAEFGRVLATLADSQANAYMSFAVQLLPDNTAGFWYLDIVEARPRIGTLLIQDLAVTNAKIADLEVGKLTAGALQAEVTVSGRIATSLTGERIEINNAGLFKYAADGTTLVEISKDDVIVTGSLQTKTTTSSRIEIGMGDARDSTVYYDVNGHSTAFLGQSYSGTTGDPLNHGLFVGSPDLDGSAFFGVVGSTESPSSHIGFILNKIKSDGSGVDSAITINKGERDQIALRDGESNTLARLFLGEVYSGGLSGTWEGMGIYGTNGDPTNYIHITEQRFYWKGTKQTGDTAVITIDAAAAEFGFENGSGSESREGVTFFENSIAAYRGSQHQFKRDDDTTWASCFALDFNPQSARAAKTDVQALPTPGLDVVRGAPVAAWRYASAPEQLHAGPMLEDLPEWMRTTAEPQPARTAPPPSPSPEPPADMRMRVVDGTILVDEPERREAPRPESAEDETPAEVTAPVPPPASSYSMVSMMGVILAALRELDAELDEIRAEKGRPVPARKTALPT